MTELQMFRHLDTKPVPWIAYITLYNIAVIKTKMFRKVNQLSEEIT